MENISKIKLPNNTIYNIIDNQPAIGSSSGELCSFSDGSTLPMPKLQVGIEPVQDLHGYDHPWVGGGGKNKQMLTVDSIINANGGASMWSNNSRTINDVTFTILTDSDGNVTGIKTNGTSSATFLFNFPLVDLEGIYTITGCPAGGSDTSYRLDIRTSSGGVLAIDKGNGDTTASFQDSVKSVIRIENNTALNNQIFYPMIRESSQPSGFAPYSNICPILGWDECNVSDVSANVWDEETKSGYYVVTTGSYISNANQLCSKDYISVRPNMTLYGYKGSYTRYGELLFYDSNHDYIGYLHATQWINKEFTIPSNCYYITFNLGSAYGATYNHDISINYPSTDTSYHAYNGNTYTIDLDGTRYGGSLDVVSGELVVDRGYVDLGSPTWSYTNNRFYYNPTNAKVYTQIEVANLLCSQYPNSQYNSQADNTISSYAGYIYVRADSYSGDVTAFKTAMNGVQLVYELATPLTYQLTPTQVKSLLGSNNVWADTGEIIDCEYVRDKYDSITAKIAEHVDWAGVNNKPTIPTAVNNVTQTATDSNNASYELLFSNTADNITRIEGTRKSSLLTFSPESSGVQLTMNYDGSRPNNYGDITIKGNNDSDSYITLHSSSAGMSYLWIKHPTPSVGIFLEGGSRSNSSSDYSQGAISADDFVVSGHDWEGNNITWDGTNTSLKAAIQSLNDRVTALENT